MLLLQPGTYSLLILLVHLINICFSLTAITSIMAQFKDLKPYHWPGWCMAALASVHAVLVLLFFTETRSVSHIKEKCSSILEFKLSLQQVKSYRIKRLLVSFCKFAKFKCKYRVMHHFSSCMFSRFHAKKIARKCTACVAFYYINFGVHTGISFYSENKNFLSHMHTVSYAHCIEWKMEYYDCHF